jgi:hypothetical protein
LFLLHHARPENPETIQEEDGIQEITVIAAITGAFANEEINKLPSFIQKGCRSKDLDSLYFLERSAHDSICSIMRTIPG